MFIVALLKILLGDLRVLAGWCDSLGLSASLLLASSLLLLDLVLHWRMQHADVFVLHTRSRLPLVDELALGLLGEAAASAEDALLVQLGPDGLELLQLLDLRGLDTVLVLPILFGFSHLMEESLELLIVFEPDDLLWLRQVLRGVFQIVHSCCPLVLRNPPGRIEDSEELLGDRNLVLGQCLLSGTFLSEAITEPLEWTRN